MWYLMSVSLIARVLFIYFFPSFYPFFRVSCVRVHRDRRVSLRRPRRQRSTFVPCPIAGRGRSPRPALTSSDYRQRPYVTATTAARKDKVGDFFLWFTARAAMTTAGTTSAAGIIRTSLYISIVIMLSRQVASRCTRNIMCTVLLALLPIGMIRTS